MLLPCQWARKQAKLLLIFQSCSAWLTLGHHHFNLSLFSRVTPRRVVKIIFWLANNRICNQKISGNKQNSDPWRSNYLPSIAGAITEFENPHKKTFAQNGVAYAEPTTACCCKLKRSGRAGTFGRVGQMDVRQASIVFFSQE